MIYSDEKTWDGSWLLVYSYSADWLVRGRHALCETGGRTRWKKDETVSVKRKELETEGTEGEVRIKRKKKCGSINEGTLLFLMRCDRSV